MAPRFATLRLGLAVATAGALLLGVAPDALAQISPPLELPGERPEEIPIPERDDEAAELLQPAPDAVPPSALPEVRVYIRAIRVTGNTVLSGDELAEIARPYTDRELATAEIEALAAEITRRYVDRGYVTSGAMVPDQDFAEGALLVRIVEGRIGDVRFEGQARLRPSALRRELTPDLDEPLNVHRLEDRLRRLHARPEVRSVHAELRPGVVLGEALLVVRVEEATPFHLAADVSNYRSPALGQAFAGVRAGMSSPAGIGDDLDIRGQFGSGLNDIQGHYRIPLTRWGTRLALRVRYSDSEVVEAPFEVLQIESDFVAAGFDLGQPLWRRGRDEVQLGLRGEWRRSRSSLGGLGFSFSEGADRGRSTVSVLRPYLYWLRQEPGQVIALRLQGSFGVPVLGATDVPGRLEDGTFISGLLQAQWARRFDSLLRTELVLRGDLQLASQPLLSIEQFSVGGHASVRGYRDNALVRDNGYAISIEARLPVLSRPDGRPILQLAPFFDVGRAWDKTEREFHRGDTLISLGAGLRWRPWDWLDADLYYGYGFNEAFDRGNDSAQDMGLYFRISASSF